MMDEYEEYGDESMPSRDKDKDVDFDDPSPIDRYIDRCAERGMFDRLPGFGDNLPG